MHTRNIFRTTKHDFAAYAETRPSLKPHLIKRKTSSSEGFQYTLDFSNSEALRELTCACLEHDFKLKVEIPPDHLIPTIPQRLNYIHWIEDLLSTNGTHPQGDQVVGVDIGYHGNHEQS